MLAAPATAIVFIAFLTSVNGREWLVSGIVAGVGVLFYWFSTLRRRADASAEVRL
jgi:uncharacterized membrane protein YjjB (DUF3815 family)